MDTMLLCNDRRLMNILGLAINFFVVGAFITTQTLFTPIMASDLLVKVSTPTLDTGQAAIQIMNETSKEKRLQEFNNKIKQKYPGAVIADVDRGVKHIKITKY